MTKFIKSFVFAANGFRHTILKEQNFLIEIIAALVVIIFSFYFKISTLEWFVVLLNIGIVLMAELFNTAIENLCNLVHPEYHPIIKIVKDTSAAAVIVVAVMASICGCIIFVPHFLNL